MTFTARSMKWRGGLADPTALKATFLAAGRVTVNGTLQQSGATANNFSEPVTYQVEADGVRKNYKVEFINFTGLPVVYVKSSTNQQPINNDITSKDMWKDATLRIEGNGEFEDLEEVQMQLRGRGNVTWGWDKKAFNIKFAEQQKVLGMKKHKRWIMLANYADITMLRNDVAYRISDLTSLEWAPKGQHVELVYNNHVINITLNYDLTRLPHPNDSRNYHSYRQCFVQRAEYPPRRTWWYMIALPHKFWSCLRMF